MDKDAGLGHKITWELLDPRLLHPNLGADFDQTSDHASRAFRIGPRCHDITALVAQVEMATGASVRVDGGYLIVEPRRPEDAGRTRKIIEALFH